MAFIGIITNKKSFDIINNNLPEGLDINLIRINEKNISNFRNIKFDMLVLNQNILEENEKLEDISKILKNVKYLIINLDLKIDIHEIENKKINIISFGMNSKSTITISSAKEEQLLIAIQRKIINDVGNVIEEEERKINISEYKDIYSSLILEIIKIVYNY